ncbi:Putative pentatricopeptide repeat-containing protein [Striga hermonthica]|uniref:Pentatricopeptide repeat-containing protein n=1 Tax=Striga hermonthica TaxID=68872 RepID=A0A9N7NWC2_STRHE|nr:Putative pentatricopeptide repeat-containing protein [Striga hermonthica]
MAVVSCSADELLPLAAPNATAFICIYPLLFPFPGRQFSQNFRKYGTNAIDAHAIDTAFNLETSRHNNQLQDLLQRNQISEARQLFDRMPQRNTLSFNMVISCHLKLGDLFHAREFFDSMSDRTEITWTDTDRTDVRPDAVTFTTVLSGCDETITKRDVSQVHAQVAKFGLRADLSLCNSLLDSYCKSQSLDLAFDFFMEMALRDTITFNTIITAAREKVRLARHRRGFPFSTMLSVAANMQDIKMGRQLHGQALVTNADSETQVANALVDMYGKCGKFGQAITLFRSLACMGTIPWTVMISAYVHHGLNA